MKKAEAMNVAIKNVNVLMEYISQILAVEENVVGHIHILAAKIDNEKRCILEIRISERNYENYWDTEIPSVHSDVINEQVFQCLLRFLDSETVSISSFYKIEGGLMQSFSGVQVCNSKSCCLYIHFDCPGSSFPYLVDDYNTQIKNYETENQLKR